jgi:hypothetical protein
MLHRGDWTPLPYHHPTSPRSHIFTLSFNSAHYIYLGNTTSTFTLHLGSIAYLGDRFSQNSGQCATQQITQDLITPDNNKRWTESFFTHPLCSLWEVQIFVFGSSLDGKVLSGEQAPVEGRRT